MSGEIISLHYKNNNFFVSTHGTYVQKTANYVTMDTMFYPTLYEYNLIN